jgi:hypothetical protein
MKMKKIILTTMAIILCIGIAFSTDFSPYGDINNRGIWKIFNATSITSNENLTVANDTLFVDGETKMVGIGTLNPSYKLDVHGNAMIRGNILLSSGIIVNVTGNVTGNIIPAVNNTYNLGNSTNLFKTVNTIDLNSCGKINIGCTRGIYTIPSSGYITPLETFIKVDTYEASASDDLDCIIGGTEGSIIYLTITNNGRQVRLRSNSLCTPSTAGLTINRASTVTLTSTNKYVFCIHNGAIWMCDYVDS